MEDGSLGKRKIKFNEKEKHKNTIKYINVYDISYFICMYVLSNYL